MIKKKYVSSCPKRVVGYPFYLVSSISLIYIHMRCLAKAHILVELDFMSASDLCSNK